MGIWIRSQNKQVLVYANEISIDEVPDGVYIRGRATTDKAYALKLGQYDDLEEAIEVMERISDHKYKGEKTSYNMPPKGFTQKEKATAQSK